MWLVRFQNLISLLEEEKSSFGFASDRSRPSERSIDGFGSWVGGLRCWEWGFGS